MNYTYISSKDFDEFLKLDGISQEVIDSNHSLLKKIFKYVYVINVLKNRVETKDFFNHEFEFIFSLLIESLHALSTGQTRASLLLLRSALESTVKFSLNKERNYLKSINPTIEFVDANKNFSKTVSNYESDIQLLSSNEIFPDYTNSIQRIYHQYSELSAVTHSNTKRIPLAINSYLADIKKGLILDQASYTDTYNKTLNIIFELLIYCGRFPISRIDSFQLQSIFKVVFRDKKATKMCQLLKKSVTL